MISLRVRPIVAVFTPGTEPRAGSRHPTRDLSCGSAASALLAPADQLLDSARQSRLEVDQLHPARGDDDPDHALVVERTHLRLPLDALLRGHLVGAVRLEVLLRDAV